MSTPADTLIAGLDKLLGLPPVKLTSPAAFAAALKLLEACRARIAEDASWLSHQEELTRKATDTAHALVHRLSAGEIGQEAAWAGLGAIIDTTHGLIDPAALAALNDAYRSLKP